MDGFDRETGEIIEQRPQLPAMVESRPQNLIFASANPGEVFGALCVMQGTMTSPKRTKDAKVEGETAGGRKYEYTYKYAPLEEIISAVQRPMADAGLAYRQFLASREGQWVMRTVIAHRSGEWFGCDYPIFWNQKKGMQGFASGVTYARRYGLMLALGIAAEDDDDANVADGNVATVQDRQKGRSGGAGRAEASGGTQTASTPTNGATAPPDAPAGDASDKEKALEQWKRARDHIDKCQTIPEIEAIFASKAWEGCKAIITKANPSQAAGAIQQLVDRAEARKTLLLGGEPMSVGEMG